MKKNYTFLLLFMLITSIASAQLVLNEAHYDPAADLIGDANGDGARDATEDEFLEFVNNSDSSLDISGYKIYDANKYANLPGTDEPRHEVPANTILSANGIYVVFGGGDVSSINAINNVIAHTASTNTLSMTNTSETMIITDSSGTVLISFDATDLNSGDNQSLQRKPAITGNFTDHKAINGSLYSPGIIDPKFANKLVLNEIFARPGATTGDANGDGIGDAADDEFIELVNNSGGSIDISGYKVYDYTRYKSGVPNHIVLPSTIIPNKGVFVLFGGGNPTGTFGEAIVQTCSNVDNKLSVTNDGDTYFITDASDNLVFVFNSLDIAEDLTAYESYTRTPDISGNFGLHREINENLRFSPGTKSDGTNFPGTLSVDKLFESNINLYLTTNNTLKVDGSLEGVNQLKIYNMLGKVVYQNSFQTKNTNNFNLSSLAKGIYIININNSLYSNLNKKILIK